MQGIQNNYDNTKHINIEGAQYQEKEKLKFILYKNLWQSNFTSCLKAMYFLTLKKIIHPFND
jgi:hypothetical protein